MWQDGERNSRYLAVALGVAVEGGLALGAWAVGPLLGRPVQATLRLNARGVALGVAATLPLLLLFAWAYCSRLPGLARIRRFFDAVLQPLLGPCSLLELAAISAAAGLGEELMFRGLLQGAVTDYLGMTAGVAIASLAFGLMHPVSPTYVALAAFMGAYLGLVWVATDNLLVAVVAHALYDFLVLAFLVRRRPADGAGAPVTVAAAEASRRER